MRTVDDYAKYRTAHRDGMTIRQIARSFHVSRRTVREALAAPEPKPYTRTKPPPAPVLGPFQAIMGSQPHPCRNLPLNCQGQVFADLGLLPSFAPFSQRSR